MKREFVAVTGARGFVGRLLVARLSDSGYMVRAFVRSSSKNLLLDKDLLKNVDIYDAGDLAEQNDVRQALADVHTVVHTAARVHVMGGGNEVEQYKKINVDGTLSLASQAVDAGVKRFIYISSVKVNGEFSEIDKPLVEEDVQDVFDPYAVSKLQAENELKRLAEKNNIELTIIRPVLVYGPGVKANFYAIMKIISKGLPLPFGAIKNKRSLVYVNNLTHFIQVCIESSKAANQTFLVSDGVDVSTPELVKKISRFMGRRVLLLPLPSWVIKVLCLLVGKKALSDRLCQSLHVDIGKAKTLLDWEPPVKLDDAIEDTVVDFLGKNDGERPR